MDNQLKIEEIESLEAPGWQNNPWFWATIIIIGGVAYLT